MADDLADLDPRLEGQLVLGDHRTPLNVANHRFNLEGAQFLLDLGRHVVQLLFALLVVDRFGVFQVGQRRWRIGPIEGQLLFIGGDRRFRLLGTEADRPRDGDFLDLFLFVLVFFLVLVLLFLLVLFFFVLGVRILVFVFLFVLFFFVFLLVFFFVFFFFVLGVRVFFLILLVLFYFFFLNGVAKQLTPLFSSDFGGRFRFGNFLQCSASRFPSTAQTSRNLAGKIRCLAAELRHHSGDHHQTGSQKVGDRHSGHEHQSETE